MTQVTLPLHTGSNRYRIQHPLVDNSTGTNIYKNPFDGRMITLPDGQSEVDTLITGCCNRILKKDDLINHLAPREEENEDPDAAREDRIGQNQAQKCHCDKHLDVRDVDLNIRQNVTQDPGVASKYHFTPIKLVTNDDGSLDFVNPYTGRVMEKFEDPITLSEYKKANTAEDLAVQITRGGEVTFLDDDGNINISAYKKIQNSDTVSTADKEDRRLGVTGCCYTVTEIGSMRNSHTTTCPKSRHNLIGAEYGYQPTYLQNVANAFGPGRNTLVGNLNIISQLSIWIGLGMHSPITTGIGVGFTGLSRIVHEVQNIDPRLRTKAERIQRVAWKILDGISIVALSTLLVSAFLTTTPAACLYVTLAVTINIYAATLGYVAYLPPPRPLPHPAHHGQLI